MITYLTLDQILVLHAEGIRQFGGSPGVRDLGLVDSAVSQPRATFGGIDLYPGLAEKAGALGFALVSNHGFIDGNKRIAYAATDVFLQVNLRRLAAQVDAAEAIVMGMADGSIGRVEFTEWVRQNMVVL